jgi:hypothetical protein
MSTISSNSPKATTEKSAEKKVLDFSAFKNKQNVNSEFSRSRKPLYVNQDEGKISGSADGAVSAADASSEDFGERLLKIRASLDRINSLMANLKKLSTHRDSDKLN